MLKEIAHVNGGDDCPAIPMLDPLVHTRKWPYCKDQTCPCQLDRKLRHVLTEEERRRGGQRRQQLPGAARHQENAYEMLKFKRPDVAHWIYRQRIKPRYMDK